MEVLSAVFEWFRDPANWSGSTGVPARMFEHIYISFLSVGISAAVALPAALYIGHTKRAEFLVTSIANLGRAIPSFAILAIMLPITIRMRLGLGFWPTVIALFLLGIPPILTNTYVGIQGVDADTIEAARGMGMTGGQVLRKLEIPLAAPLIVAGFRTALVQVIATATLAALVAWGGLGRFIIDGFAVRDEARIAAGAILVAALAIAAELSFGLVQRLFAVRLHR
ncbi:MAG: ABC transporter permease [Actinobacteria bacterium]|nr:ABC transporter permease [Actinomycetota bacterium]